MADPVGADEALARGREALRRAAWGEARRRFEAVLAERESPEALLGLGLAARGEQDGEAALAAHQGGYRLARRGGDARLAERCALELALDCLSFRGPAQARGWLERAGRLLADAPAGAEHGLLAYLRARFALAVAHDPAAARAFAAQGAALARSAGLVDGELACRALEGLALVAQGRVEAGMPLLDEAATAALAGEVDDPQIVEVVCCHLIDACQRVRDLDRAGEWCRRVEEVAERLGDAALFQTCRTLYGEVLLWQGAWQEAERTLTAACRALAGARAKAADGLVRLAELRRRQGRREEAAALLAECGEHRLAPVVRGALALDGGDAEGAAAEAERYLRRVGAEDRLERVPGLELLVQARLALGDVGAARAAAGELAAIAAAVGTGPLRAAALRAAGAVAAGDDPGTAVASLEDAVDLFAAGGMRYETALARSELAHALRRLGRERAAERAAETARAELRALGLETPAPRPERRRGELTRREREVLRLLAQGRSNDEIAAALVLSVRTVESHVASVYAKLGVGGRSARAAATAHALRQGLA